MVCAHCGKVLAENARACPHCGSDFETGWNDDVDYMSVELPDDDDGDPYDTPEHRQNRVRAIGVVVLIGVLGSYLAFGPLFWRALGSPFGKVVAIGGAFAATLWALRFLRR